MQGLDPVDPVRYKRSYHVRARQYRDIPGTHSKQCPHRYLSVPNSLEASCPW